MNQTPSEARCPWAVFPRSSATVSDMTYDGEGPPPRGRGPSSVQRNPLPGVDRPSRADTRRQQPSTEQPREWTGEGRRSSRRPYDAGHGGSPSRQGDQTDQPAGFNALPLHPASRGEMAQRSGPYQGGEYVAPSQPYGRSPSESGSAAVNGGSSGEHGTGHRRGAATYGAARQQPQVPSRRPEQADAEPNAGHRTSKPLVFAVIFAVLAIGGGGGWYYLRSSADAPRTEQERRVADQMVDPVPLTVTEVFDSGVIPAAEGPGPYKILKAQGSTNCKVAAGGAIAEILATAGCTQVVRATLMSSDDTLVITTGVFNLETDRKAEEASALIKSAVDAEKGRFSGLVAGGASDIINRAAANVAWDVRGHYLMYCLIANADGSAIAVDDPRTQAVRSDLVERHFGDFVFQKREYDAG